ncbi:MAG: hypothetical protein B7X34_05645 [Acidobacteriia bacterium 12-62-4]|nr:MAG: hypothetical protein B7X34_05645 [Acidobacteriia bacterium 12-62-4]
MAETPAARWWGEAKALKATTREESPWLINAAHPSTMQPLPCLERSLAELKGPERRRDWD